ncbi:MULTISPECIES: hypothetical protein [Myxococcus]|nr:MULTISPECIES: hypothetical protein [Myxococcus]WAM23558.1 hypothetical protein OZ403_23655 [Myxococcus sp. NMCA1]
MLQEAGTWTGTGPHALMASMNDVLEDIRPQGAQAPVIQATQPTT